MSSPFQIFVCASGGGGNFQALIDARAQVGFSIAGLAVDRECGAIQRARDFDIPVHELEGKGGAAISAALDAILDDRLDLVVLAGFMPIVSKSFCQKWAGKVINTHPSLLPKHGGKGMYGVKVQEAVLLAGDTEAGCTVHYVNETIDGGSVILQQAIPVLPGESAWDLGGRVFREENKLLVRAISDIMKQRGH
jgi:phosphoribosylglycinamide formyltransferase-1